MHKETRMELHFRFKLLVLEYYKMFNNQSTKFTDIFPNHRNVIAIFKIYFYHFTFFYVLY